MRCPSCACSPTHQRPSHCRTLHGLAVDLRAREVSDERSDVTEGEVLRGGLERGNSASDLNATKAGGILRRSFGKRPASPTVLGICYQEEAVLYEYTGHVVSSTAVKPSPQTNDCSNGVSEVELRHRISDMHNWITSSRSGSQSRRQDTFKAFYALERAGNLA